MVKICVFDTETSGLPPYLPGETWNKRNANDAKLLDYSDLSTSHSMWEQMLSSWPSIIQLSYIVYDLDNPNHSKIFNKYIDIHDDVVIEQSSLEIHHIDREKIRNEPAENKALIHDALMEFMRDIMNPDVVSVVGHNVQFDRKMIIAELLQSRKRLNSLDRIFNIEKELYFLMNDENFTCSMDVTAPICNIQIAVNYKDKKTGEDKVFYKMKSPKLIESYQYYFGYSPDADALHDALIDVILCLRVYIKYKYNEDISGKNEIITEYIKQISPEGYICNGNNVGDNVRDNVDIENIKLEIIEIFNDDLETGTTPRKTKSKKRSKSKNKKQKTKRRRSKRLMALQNKKNNF